MTREKGRARPGSIRNRILFISILVTLVPSFGMGWFWFDLSRTTTTAMVEQKLLASADIIEREIGLWFKERNYDLRVFSNSFIVAENLPVYHNNKLKGAARSPKTAAALKKISTYLDLIITSFPAYHRLSVLDVDGRIIASSAPSYEDIFITLPENWKAQVARSQYFVGDQFLMADDDTPHTLVGIPLLLGESDEVIGFFMLEVKLDTILSLLYSSLPQQEAQKYASSITLFEKNGRIIFGTSLSPQMTRPAFVPAEVLELIKSPRQLREYSDDQQVRLMGIAFALKGLPWSILIEENKEDVFAGLMEARNKILLITLLLTIVIGGGAIMMARYIIIPLKALTDGVLKVANGDLEVSVPLHKNDELGIVSTMFNEMVRRLREDQLRLEEMATTDPLTGLANRKQIMTVLNLQMEGFCRHATDFAVLMLDIDFFKNVNDSYGHQAGDAVLCEVAQVLNNILRSRDTAGRYGGEEFIVILDTTDLSQAMLTAERIRKAVEDCPFNWQSQVLRVTVSIGVTAVTVDDETVDALISRVDKALYKAKDDGRNRIVSDAESLFSFLEREEKFVSGNPGPP